MNVQAWCGVCGEPFGLAEVLAAEAPGSCPRCGYAFAPSYAAVLSTAVRRLITAAETLGSAGRQLGEVAPHLHIDRQQLAADLADVLGR